MASHNSAKDGGPPKGPKAERGISDETVAKAAGAVIGVGIAWSLFRSLTGKQRDSHTGEHLSKEADAQGKGFLENAGKDLKESLEGAGRAIKGTLVGNKKEIQHHSEYAGKEMEHKTKEVGHNVENKGRDLKEAAGRELRHLGHRNTQKGRPTHEGLHKKHDGDNVRVHHGDTLWGISREYGVTVDALKAANGIIDGHIIAAGDTLVVP